MRHPFPGPGLGVRVVGQINQNRLKVLKEADAIFIEELRKSGWYSKLWQAFVCSFRSEALALWEMKGHMRM